MAEATQPSKSKKSDKKNQQMSNVFSKDDIDLLLIGKTGNGKSATGNSILDRLEFESEPSCESVTTSIESAVVEFKKRKIKVVDGPGIGDTHHIDDLEAATELVMDKMADAVTLNPDGYHAFLLVVKFGNRLTAEDKECIRILKAIFGDFFVRDYCILLVTNGDDFYSSIKQKGTSFKTWCQKQGGIFQELYNECNKRAVLFNNKTKDPTVRKKQIKKLIITVDELQHKGRRYSNDHFKMAYRSREQLMVKVKEPRIRQDALEKIDIFMQRKKSIRSKDINVQTIEMKELKKEIQSLLSKVQEADNQSGLLDALIRTLNYLLEETEGNIQQIDQLGVERKLIVERKEEARKMLFDVDFIENELKLKFEKLLIENGSYNDEIKDLEREIENEDMQVNKSFKFTEDKLKKEIRFKKGHLKNRNFTDATQAKLMMQEIETHERSNLDRLRSEKMKALSKIKLRKADLENKKQLIRDEIMMQILGTVVNEKQQEMIKLIEEIDQLAKEFDQRRQELSNSSEEKDQNIIDRINEMKDDYIDELNKVKSKSKQKCRIQ